MKVTQFKDDPLVQDQQYQYAVVERFILQLASTLKSAVITTA